MFSFRSPTGRRPRRLALLPAVALACAAFAVPYLGAPQRALANSASQLDIASFSDTGIPTVGVPLGLAIIPSDANDNWDPCFDDTIHFSDLYATVPADHTFQAVNLGIFCIGDMYFFDMTPLRPGPQTLPVTDLNNASIAGTMTMDVLPGPAKSFAVTPLKSTARTGSPAGFQLTVRDGSGFLATSYTGTVHFTSDDPTASLPADCTFNADDAGSRVFLVTFNTTGTRSVTATDVDHGALSASATITVASAPHFDIQWMFSNQGSAGNAMQFIVTAQNDDGSTDTGYRGTVHFTSSDSSADLPIDHAFTGTDNGSFSWQATFEAAGTQTFTVTDTLNPGTTGVSAVDIVGGDPVAATVTGLPSVMIAGPVTVIVTQTDAYGNNASDGMVHFTSTDTKAVLPANFTFHASDHGTHQFQLTLATAGLSAVSVHGGYGAGFTVTHSTTVVHGAATTLAVGGIASPTAAGVARTLTVRATDPYGNTDPDYYGTVHFTSTDAKAVLPANYTFAASDGGSHAFSVTLKTAGNQAVRARDTVMSAITGIQGRISVVPGSVKTLVLSGLVSPYVAGAAHSVTVTAVDAYGNTTTGYRGKIHFTSSDALATLPADYTFTATDAGAHRFSLGVILKTAGGQAVRARDTLKTAITGLVKGIVVTPAAATTLAVTGLGSPRSAGAAGTIMVTAVDPYGNTATGYRGTVHFTSTDAAASLPPDYTFTTTDSGSRAFSVALNTAGTQAIRARDTVTSTVTGLQTGIVVS